MSRYHINAWSEPGCSGPAEGCLSMGERKPRPPTSKKHVDREDVSVFAARLLDSLTGMAARDRRREADVAAALLSVGIPASHALVPAALRFLYDKGCVTNMLALSDGGLLLTVTGVPIDPGAHMSPWLPSDTDEG